MARRDNKDVAPTELGIFNGIIFYKDPLPTELRPAVDAMLRCLSHRHRLDATTLLQASQQSLERGMVEFYKAIYYDFNQPL
jgi:hypothetical protein